MARPLYARRAYSYARRAWPFVLAAYRRWEQMTPEEKERYRRRAQQTVERGRKVYRERVPRGRGGLPRRKR
jgi:hypothetical protein